MAPTGPILGFTFYPLFTILGIVLFIGVYAIIYQIFKAKKKDKALRFMNFNGIFVLFFSIILTIAPITTLVSNHYQAGKLENIKDIYGVNISVKNLNELYYPAEAPKEDFRIYGNTLIPTVEDEKLSTSKVVLIWEAGELKLYQMGENKEIGSELPRENTKDEEDTGE